MYVYTRALKKNVSLPAQKLEVLFAKMVQNRYGSGNLEVVTLLLKHLQTAWSEPLKVYLLSKNIN